MTAERTLPTHIETEPTDINTNTEVETSENNNDDNNNDDKNWNGRDKRQAINTKEDYEVLNGLTYGNKIHEENETIRGITRMKIIDLL